MPVSGTVYSYLVLYHCFFIRPRVGYLPRSLDPPKDRSITVQFYAILPMEAWEWDKDSAVYIRFMFGDDVPDIGPGNIIR